MSYIEQPSKLYRAVITYADGRRSLQQAFSAPDECHARRQAIAYAAEHLGHWPDREIEVIAP